MQKVLLPHGNPAGGLQVAGERPFGMELLLPMGKLWQIAIVRNSYARQRESKLRFPGVAEKVTGDVLMRCLVRFWKTERLKLIVQII